MLFNFYGETGGKQSQCGDGAAFCGVRGPVLCSTAVEIRTTTFVEFENTPKDSSQESSRTIGFADRATAEDWIAKNLNPTAEIKRVKSGTGAMTKLSARDR
jgi:hypothetical protein